MRAPSAWTTEKARSCPFQVGVPKLEALRPSIQVSICFAETTATPRACADATMSAAHVRRLRGARVRVHVGGERAVVLLRAERAVEQRVDREGVRLAGLVGHLGRGLVDVDEAAVGLGEAHRHARAGEEAGAVLHPGRAASSSSSCRAGSGARARPPAGSPSHSRRCSACGSSPERARSGTAPRSRRAGSRRSSRARPASSWRSRCSRAARARSPAR